MSEGYYRFPTICGDRVAFICEDDLWAVPASGGVARRLTSNLGAVSRAFFSPDGALLAFTGREEGPPEVYVMPADGGEARRLTHLGAMSSVEGWTPDGSKIVFSSNARQPMGRIRVLYTIDRNGASLPQQIPVGPATTLAYGPEGALVIGRNAGDPARWKRYHGGTAGELWIDRKGDGQFRPLIRLKGNLASPMWIGGRVYFLSDHEGIGNLYSCTPAGKGLRRHTDCEEFYLRFPSTDGRRVVYHAGADLFVYDPAVEQASCLLDRQAGRLPHTADASTRIEARLHSPRIQCSRKFVPAEKYLDDYAPHPKGHSAAVTSRGKLFSMALWEGPVNQHESHVGSAAFRPSSAQDTTPETIRAEARTTNEARHRLAQWLHDGERLVAVTDATGEERLQIHRADLSEPPVLLDALDIGHPYNLNVSPKADLVALSNHRCELLVVDLAKREMKVADRSTNGPISGGAWSADGRWLAYSFGVTPQTRCLKLYDTQAGTTHEITKAVLFDVEPAFDPDGKYLYFLGFRELDPVYDNLHFDLNFPRGMRPYLITLRKDLPSPFVPVPRAPGEKPDEKKNGEAKKREGEAPAEPKEEKPVQIDLDGIEHRIVAFPVPLGRYGQIAGLGGGRVLFTSFPVEGTLNHNWFAAEPTAKGTLEMFDFDKQEKQTLVSAMSDFALSEDGKTMLYRAARRLRALKAGEKPDEKVESEGPGRKSGWLDLARLKVSVVPLDEWRQMFREAWRLQRDHFWTPDMSKVDWERVYARYLPLVDRIGTRAEFSDLMWEVQGELGTSHAYEFGGDYRPQPDYGQGHLGADFEHDPAAGGYRVTRIIRGDSWNPDADSPLNAPGINVQPGDVLTAIGGRPLGPDLPPGRLLVNQAGSEVLLTFAAREGEAPAEPSSSGDAVPRSACPTVPAEDTAGQASRGTTEPTKPRTVAVKALRGEEAARYRQWVETHRERVHRETAGRVGYVHIPDMGPRGFAEFHRLYLTEYGRDALIVDVRYNGGGHVSQLLLEKLARRRVGYDLPRWGSPDPYPAYSVIGPIVAITNESAGSDGDIFSHCFKLMKLGTLIGKRTWGGVIGIGPRSSFVDGGLTTQPEYSFWFKDVGWGVENYGTDPDIEVDNKPQDYAAGRDPQLERAIRLILRQLKAHPPERPDFSRRPDLSLPKLPPR